jgi:hypothetical protein
MMRSSLIGSRGRPWIRTCWLREGLAAGNHLPRLLRWLRLVVVRVHVHESFGVLCVQARVRPVDVYDGWTGYEP